MVQGHVDGKGVLTSITPEAGAWRLIVDLPAALSRYCVAKGSITLNGISLTINTLRDLEDGRVTIGLMIIPHTWEHTNLHAAKVGDAINVEVDVMAKYVERLSQPYGKADTRAASGVDEIAQSDLPSAYTDEPLRVHAFRNRARWGGSSRHRQASAAGRAAGASPFRMPDGRGPGLAAL